MKIQLIIDYEENLKGNAEIKVVSMVDPPVDISTTYLLGVLELAKEYILNGVG